MDVQPDNPPLRICVIQTAAGNRQHYYHFFFGFLLPLCRYLALTGEAELPLILRSCGPLDSILHELGLPRLMLAGSRAHRTLVETMPNQLARRIGMTGFDLAKPESAYDREAIVTGARWLRQRWAERIATQQKQLTAQWGELPRVLVIDRAKPEPFYTSWLSEDPRRTVGADRRRVPNHAEVVAALKQRYPGTRTVQLEGMPLATQIALFEMADVIVAQHGAALANLVWMRPGSRVIEFEGGEPKHMAYFSKLSAVFDLAYRSFPQDGPFGPIDAAALTAAIDEMLAPRAPAAVAAEIRA